MSTNGILDFQGTNKATFVGANSNVVIDTVNASFGIGVDVNGPTSNLHVVGNAYVTSNLEVGTANLFVDTVNSRVGIGTTSPKKELHVYGDGTETDILIGEDTAIDKTSLIRYKQGDGSATGVLQFGHWGDSFGTNPKTLCIKSGGNVGIGTTSPQAKLEISSTTQDSSDSSNNVNQLRINCTSALSYAGTGGGITFCQRYWNGSSSMITTGGVFGARLGGTDGSYGGGLVFKYKPNGSGAMAEGMVLSSNGRVGIGTIDPPCLLTIDGGTGVNSTGGVLAIRQKGDTVDDGITLTSSSANSTRLYKDGSGHFYIHTGGSDTVFQNQTGNVGIGTTSPQQKLEVHGNILLGQNDIQSFIHGGSDIALSSDNDVLIVSDSNDTGGDGAADIIFGAGSAINMDTSRNFTFAQAYPSAVPRLEHMRILGSNGNVGIGTTDPDNKLHVVGGTDTLYLEKSTAGGGVGIKFTDDTSKNQHGYLRYYHLNTESFGTGNCFRFSSTEDSETLACGGALLIGVDGKDNGVAVNGRKNLFIQSTYNGNTSQNYGWWLGAQNANLASNDNDFYFNVVRNGTLTSAGWIQDNLNNIQMNFTGQHRTFVKDTPTNQLDSKEGLIVVADQNEFIKMSGGVAYGKDAITINESLPLVSLSTKAKDKRCFGVLSTTEDPETRKEVHGNFASLMQKEEGDTRVYVNSVGEGAIWVVNTNGILESGDYITTSNVTGYGMKQDDDILHNYTVAKILMDCDFNPPTQVKRVIKKESRMIDYWIRYGDVKITEEEYQTLPETKRKIIEDVHYRIDQMEVVKENPEKDTFVYEQREEMVNVLDEHGEFQWEDTDETEKAYKIRYLDADGNITDEANAVHKAAFVGCTYHCG